MEALQNFFALLLFRVGCIKLNLQVDPNKAIQRSPHPHPPCHQHSCTTFWTWVKACGLSRVILLCSTSPHQGIYPASSFILLCSIFNFGGSSLNAFLFPSKRLLLCFSSLPPAFLFFLVLHLMRFFHDFEFLCSSRVGKNILYWWWGNILKINFLQSNYTDRYMSTRVPLLTLIF